MKEERNPADLDWAEFVRLVDAALFLAFLVDEIPASLAEIAPRIASRISDTWGSLFAERIDEAPSDFPGIVEEYLMDLESDVKALGAPDAASYTLRSLAIISMHSALDVYARARLPEPAKARLPEFVDDSLRSQCDSPLERKLYNHLVEFDATRHLFVHNNGFVDRRYADRVCDNQLIQGERRPLDTKVLLHYAQVVLQTAHAIRDCTRRRAHAES